MPTRKHKIGIQNRRFCANIAIQSKCRLGFIDKDVVKLSSKPKAVRVKVVETTSSDLSQDIARVVQLNKKYRRTHPVAAFIGENFDKHYSAKVLILGNRTPVRHLSGAYIGDIVDGLNNVGNQNDDKKPEKSENE